MDLGYSGWNTMGSEQPASLDGGGGGGDSNGGQSSPQQQQNGVPLETLIAQFAEGQQRLGNQLGYLQRQIRNIERRGDRVPEALQQQISQVTQAIEADQEEKRLASMTTDEQLTYFRTKAQEGRQGGGTSRGGGASDAEGLSAEEIQALADEQYESTVLPEIAEYCNDLGFNMTEQLKQQLDQIPVRQKDNEIDWSAWRQQARTYLRSVAKALRDQAANQQPSPARQAGRALGSPSRGGGPAAPAAPDYKTASFEELYRFSMAQERAQGKRQYA